MRDLGTPLLIHQPKYSMLVRDPEQGLLDVLGKEGVGCIVFSPLAQGLLSDRYLQGIPSDSRAAHDFFLKRKDIDERKVAMLRELNTIAQQRGQSPLPRWLSHGCCADPRVTARWSAPAKCSRVDDNVAALKNLSFSSEELAARSMAFSPASSPPREQSFAMLVSRDAACPRLRLAAVARLMIVRLIPSCRALIHIANGTNFRLCKHLWLRSSALSEFHQAPRVCGEGHSSFRFCARPMAFAQDIKARR